MTEKLTVSIDVNKIVVPAALEYIEDAFRAGFDSGDVVGRAVGVDHAWQEYRTSLIDEPVNAEPIRQPLTLDDVSQRINTICNDYVKQVVILKAGYGSAVDALAEAVEASPDIDQDAVVSIVLGRVKAMMTEIAEVVG